VKRHGRAVAVTLAALACAVGGLGARAAVPATTLPPVERDGVTERTGSVDPGASAPRRTEAWRVAAAPVRALTLAGAPGYVHPTTDLDGDRIPDVTVLTSSPATLACLSGADGHTLHTFALGDDHAVQPVDAAWSAMLVTTATTTKPGPTDPPHDVTLTISWVDGCVRRWARSLTGRVYAPGGMVSSELPYVRGLLPGAARTDVLVEQQSVLAPPSGTAVRTSTTILSGADGATLLTTDPEDYVNQEPTLVPMPDISGDGRADYLTALRRRDAGPVPSSPDQLVAHSAADGTVLWTREAANDFDTAVTAAGDVTDDGVTDVVVGTVVSPIDTVLLDGATGDVLWAKPGQVAQVLGAGGRGPYVSVERLVPGERLRYEVATYDARGELVYRVRRDLGPGGDVDGVIVSADTLGDIDLDAFRDTAYSVTASRAGSATTVSWLLSGRTGRTRNANVRALKPDDAAAGTGSLDTRGDDVWEQQGTAVSLRAGNDLTRLATATAPGAVASLLTTQIDRSACVDLVALVTYRGSRSVVAISGRTGAMAWSVPPLPDAARPALTTRTDSCAATPAARPRSPRRLPATGAAPTSWAALLLAAAAVVARGVNARR